MHDDALGIYLFPASQIVQDAAKNAIGRRARLDGSATDEYSWDVQVDSVPEGFKVIQSESGSNFFCAMCDNPVEP